MPESPAGPDIVDLAFRELAVFAPALLMQIFFLTGLRATPVRNLKVGDDSFAPPQMRAWVKGRGPR